ncbi:Uncharacterised protein [Raoultella ornithinolytica]|nr:Uncharacterised protein [Raoultella ornithinolytica]
MVAMNIDAIAGFHPYVALNTVVLAEGNPDNGDRHANVTQHHSPLAARNHPQAAPETVPVGRPFMDFNQGKEQYPNRHHQTQNRHGDNPVLQQPRQQQRK